MGLLSGLLNPFSTKNPIANPGGYLVGSAMGANKSPASGATDAQPGAMATPDTSGDPSDPAFGSFTQPFGVEQFYDYADPGYAFQLQQGNQALQNSAAMGGSALGGAAIKDLLKYNQDYAGSAYNDAFNRYQTQQGNIFSRLSSLLQLGQNSASNVGAQGTQLAGQAGQAAANAGAASGAGVVGAGNNIGAGLTNYWLMRQFGGGQQQAVSGGV